MRWRQVDRTRAQAPTKGTWVDWKPIVREQCWRRCVYCAIPEGRFGGERNFHVEHYRPKDLTRFEHLINSIFNLFYACSVCNSFKRDDWPADPAHDHSVAAYPDPSASDFNLLFETSEYRLSSKTVAGRYMCNRLALNRWQLIMERREAHLVDRISSLEAFANPIIDAALKGKTLSRRARKILVQIRGVLAEVGAMRDQLREASPYERGDLSRPAKAKANSASG